MARNRSRRVVLIHSGCVCVWVYVWVLVCEPLLRNLTMRWACTGPRGDDGCACASSRRPQRMRSQEEHFVGCQSQRGAGGTVVCTWVRRRAQARALLAQRNATTRVRVCIADLSVAVSLCGYHDYVSFVAARGGSQTSSDLWEVTITKHCCPSKARTNVAASPQKSPRGGSSESAKSAISSLGAL